MSISIDDDLAQLSAAGERDKQNTAHEAFIKSGGQAQATGVSDWVMNLPKNVGVGLLDAAINTARVAGNFATDVGAKVKQDVVGPGLFERMNAQEQGLRKPAGGTPQHLREASLAAPMSDPEHNAAMSAVTSLRDEMARGGSTADAVTQGVAQFAIPFMGWSKILGGLKGGAAIGTIARTAAAESATAATAFDPHGPRMADLYQLGQHTEGKLGDALNAAAPDGSLVNAYINYMTSRDNEGEAEGRFKNVVDNLVGSAAAAGVIKTGATAFKVARKLPGYIADSGAGPVGASAQRGQIVFHGTPHDFDAFDTSKIGTGEGNQSFGYGLYFAENPNTASTYHRKLSQRTVTKGSPMETALDFVRRNGGDERAAYTELKGQAATASPENADNLARAADIVKNGNAKLRGNVMEVDIPDEKVAQMLDHDAEMSKQPHVLQKVPEHDKEQLERMLEDHGQDGSLEDFTGNQFYQLIKRAISEDYIAVNPADGNFDNTAKLASEYLSEKGVPGIRFLDSGSRGKGDGTRNIVLFSDKDAKITKKNGKLVRRATDNKFSIVPAENGFAVYVNGKPSLAFNTVEEAEAVVKDLGGTPPPRPSEEDIARTLAGMKRKRRAADVPALQQ